MTVHIERPASRPPGAPSPAATPVFRERRGMPSAPPIRLAHIVSVSGSHAVAVLERQDAITNADSRIQIGALVKIITPVSAVMGIVSAVSAPMSSGEGDTAPLGLVEINLMGEVAMDAGKRLTFRRGVSALPSLGDGVLLADKHDLTRVYAPPQAASVKIGSLFQDNSVPARLLVDDLLAKHFLVVGSTGSGKSSALTCILQRLLSEHSHAHVMILDVHNEYSASFGGLVEPISLDNFHLPFWMLDFLEMTAALVSRDSHHDAEVEILSEGVVFAKRRYNESATARSAALARKSADSHVITVDTPTPFRMSDVIAFIDEQLGRLERSQLTLPYRRLKSRIETLVSDQRYNFMFGSLSVQDTMGDVLARLFRVPSEGRPISVIDLSTVPPEILDVVISVISRLAFDLAVWSKGGLPMLLVCEEAHRYAPADDRKFVPTRHALSRIAKEGRKYGLSLALVTQRPCELDATIVSQCGTAIVLRLSSERDQDVIRGSTYEGMSDLIEFLPLLGDREALVLGQGVSMPMRVRFDDIGKNIVPRGGHSSFSKGWKAPNMDRAGLDTIVARWRNAGREKA
jgi:DNA helicase HerA-like ATPase